MLILLLIYVIFKLGSCSFASHHHVAERALLFPQYTTLQFTYGLSVPVILPNRTFQLSLCVQQNYDLPFNISNFSPVIFTARDHAEDAKEADDGFDMDRYTFYNYIADFISSFGFDGEQCLLRAICEISEVPMHTEEENTLLENILHFVFTPSADIITESDDEQKTEFYENVLEAEDIGRSNGNCQEEYSECDFSFVDLFTSKIAT